MEELKMLMADLKEDELLQKIKELLEAGEDPQAIFDACQEGMSVVGSRFESGEYFLSDLIMSGEVFRQVSEVITPYFCEGEETKSTARWLLVPSSAISMILVKILWLHAAQRQL